MSRTLALGLSVLWAGIAAGCVDADPQSRFSDPKLAQLEDEQCQALPQCKRLADACGENPECRDAMNEVIEDHTPGREGDQTTLVAKIIERYAQAAPQ